MMKDWVDRGKESGASVEVPASRALRWRRHIGTKLLAGVMLALGACFTANAEDFPVVTFEGVLIDLHCYARAIAQGQDADIATDAQACQTLEDSNPVALLVERSDGTRVYGLASPPLFLVEHLGRAVRITGQLREQAALIKPEKAQVRRDGVWVEMPLLPEM